MPVPALLGAASDTVYGLDGDVVVRLLVAAVLGGIIGLEREASDQAAGLRTHIALALGAALFGVVSTLGFTEFDRPRSETVLQVDVTRVASNVAVGVGFLGAGVIFRQRNSIKNLTTAASLWAVAAIGLASGVGDPTTAAVATAVLLLSLVVLRPVRTFVRRRWARRSMTVTVHLAEGTDPTPVVDHVRERRRRRRPGGVAQGRRAPPPVRRGDGPAAYAAALDDGAVVRPRCRDDRRGMTARRQSRPT